MQTESQSQTKTRAPRYYGQTEARNSSEKTAPLSTTWTPNFASTKVDATAPTTPAGFTVARKELQLHSDSSTLTSPLIPAESQTSLSSVRPKLTLLFPSDSSTKAVPRSDAHARARSSSYTTTGSPAHNDNATHARTHARSVSYNTGTSAMGVHHNSSYRSSASDPLPSRKPSIEPRITLTKPEGSVLKVLLPRTQGRAGGEQGGGIQEQAQSPVSDITAGSVQREGRMSIDSAVTKSMPLSSHPYSRSNSGASKDSERRRHTIDENTPPPIPPRPQRHTMQNPPIRSGMDEDPPKLPPRPQTHTLQNPPLQNQSMDEVRPDVSPISSPGYTPLTFSSSGGLRHFRSSLTLNRPSFLSLSPSGNVRDSLASTRIDENTTANTAPPVPQQPSEARQSRPSLSNNTRPSYVSNTTPSITSHTSTSSTRSAVSHSQTRPTSDSPTSTLQSLATHIQTQVTLTRHLFNIFHTYLSQPEAHWMACTISDTEAAVRDVLLLAEALRVDTVTNGGKLGIRGQIRWVVKDSRRAREKRERLVLCGESLGRVLGRLQGVQAQVGRQQSNGGLQSQWTRNGSSGTDAGRDPFLEPTDDVAGKQERRDRESSDAPPKPDSPPWDLSVQLQDPGMELVVDKPASVKDSASMKEVQLTRPAIDKPVENDTAPASTKLDNELLDMLSWRWAQGRTAQ